MSRTALSIRGLCVERGGRRVLQQLDLDLEAGAYLVLVGGSGSGKTSLLRAIAGLLAPQEGTIELSGTLVTRGPRLLVAPHKRGLGFVFQGGGLWPHMSARSTLEFVLRQRGLAAGERKRRALELLEEVELPGFAERMPATLSGGEAQRLSLARALASEPGLLLLDEPLAGVDAELRAALVERLRSLRQRQGWSAIHVTHDPREAHLIATRALRLEHGRCQDAQEVLQA